MRYNNEDVNLDSHLEVDTTGGQHYFMRLEVAPLCRQCNIDQGLCVQQRREHADEVWLVVVPSQAELLY